ncbi:diguanylate cyclase [Azospirillum sp. TSH100]|nr:diguanylate cyclase [Azospirillum sp. TSH100]
MIANCDAHEERGAAFSVLDCLPVGVCVVAASGIIHHANPALHELLGCEPGGLPGRSLCEFGLECCEAGTPVADPARAQRAFRNDGSSRWVTVAEAALTRPRPGMEAGYEVEGLRLVTVTDVDSLRRQGVIVDEGAAQSELPVADTLLEHGGTRGYKVPDRLAQGATRSANLTRAAFRDGSDEPAGILGSLREPGDPQPNHERLEAILEQSPIGVSVSRRDDGRIIFVNTRFAELIGLPREKLIGSRARDYYLDSHQRLRVLDGLRDGGGVTNMEVQFKRADGSPFWTLFTVNQAVIQGTAVNLAWIYDYTERRSMEEALRDMASRDPLTGIYNRRSFMDMARAQLARAHRFHEPLSVFVLDVDHFKRINDTFGHATGDDALRMVAAGCQAILREYDILGRLGGEEFVVVLPGATADESRVVAERVRRHLARMPIEAPDGTFRLTASIGIAGLEGATDTLERAIHRADLALYRAKHLGRNRVAVFEPGM